MKIAFSTLACPTWSLDTIVSKGREWGCDGIELRGLEDAIYLPRHPQLSGSAVDRTREKIRSAGLTVVALGSSAELSAPEDRWDSVADEIKDYLSLAVRLNCPVVRIYGGSLRDLSWEQYFALVSERLYRISEWADSYPVRLALETHDAIVRARDLAEILRRVTRPNVGAVWDIHHSFRAGEPVPESADLLGKWIVDVHVKDSVATDGTVRYVPLGQGTVPLRQALAQLKERGYDGPITIEWEKRWIKELEKPEVVLPGMIATLKSWLTQSDSS